MLEHVGCRQPTIQKLIANRVLAIQLHSSVHKVKIVACSLAHPKLAHTQFAATCVVHQHTY